MVNLLGNAIKFTKEGEIFVSVRRNGDVYWKDEKRFLNFIIQVKDTGIGIAKEKLQKKQSGPARRGEVCVLSWEGLEL
jgi:signal transduction histidine kinase